MKNPNIIFIADFPWERPAKIATALRNRGISVLLIYVTEPNNFDPREYFEYTIKADTAEEAVTIAHRLRPGLIHLFSYGADKISYYLFRNRVGKIIYDYKDCFENVISPPSHDAWHTVQRQSVELADGLCCRDLQLWNYCKVNNIRPKGKRMLFLDYCWGQSEGAVSNRSDGEVHTVLAGNFTVEKMTPVSTDSGYIHTARALTGQGVHVHIYPRWHYQYITDRDQMSDYLELAEKSPYFHIHESVPMSEFTKELSQYDFGLGIFQGALFHEIGIHSCQNGHEKHGMATRWFDYLEAGLDILASPELNFMYRVMRNAGVAVPATPELFLKNDVKAVLAKRMKEYKQLRINAARHKLDINKNIDRLIGFYQTF